MIRGIRTSILTCVHNGEALLDRAAASVQRQRDPRFEWLVLDDGSTDGTWHKLGQLRRRLPRMRIFRHSTQLGLTRSRNALLEESRGLYLGILDVDDAISPGKTGDHAELLDGDPSVGMAWGRAWLVDARTGARRSWPPAGFTPGWDILGPYAVAHSATTWRRTAVVRAGGYLERFTLAEAPDLFLRIGDFAGQCYLPRLAAVVRWDPAAPLASARRTEGPALSRLLLAATLARRYGASIRIK